MPLKSWTTLSRLLDEALEIAPADRSRWVDGLGPEHAAMRPRLRSILGEAGSLEAAGFLETIPKLDAGDGEAMVAGLDEGQVLDTVGPYHVLRKLAEGGMGAVWLARRTDAMRNRLVALKLPRGAWPRAGLAERMAREREILATLDHANIARLYDAGMTITGQPYLALEYVAGQPLDDYAKTRRLPLRARLHLFLQVARAVAHAHARLIVHRDLKPSNILVTDDGAVKLLDFGIAKLLEDSTPGETSITEASGRPLTPDYASPEQIAGEPLSIATDVYSLGVILYELLAGVRPYTCRRDSRRALDEAILRITPQRPSDATVDPSMRRLLHGDLDTIVLKALKKSPEERYATVNGFAEDIDRYLHGQPVLARPESTWYRLSKCVARNKLAVGAAAAIVVTALAGAALATWQAHVALTQKAHAEEVRDFLTTIFRDASPYNGGRALSAVDWLKQVKARVDHRLGDRPELRVELLNIVGSSLLTLQDTAAADVVLTQAVQEATNRLGADHPETVRARVLMTPVHRFRGRTSEMRAELERLLPALRRNAAGPAEPLVMALKNQAHLEVDDGRYPQAEAAAREAVDIGVARLGERHPETVAALLMLAYAHQFSRSPDVALRTAERAHRLTLAMYHDTPKHPRAIEGRLVYGRALAEAGELVRGVEQLAEAVSDAADVFGSSSRMVGFFSRPLSRFQVELGEIREAQDNGRRAVDIVGQHSKPDSFNYAVALHARGAALLAARRPVEALPDLTRASDTLRRLFAPSHGLTGIYQADLALALARAGRHREAQRMIEGVLPQGRRPDDRSASWPRYVLGVVNRLAGNHHEALRVQQQSLQSMHDDQSGELDRMRILTEVGLNLQDLAKSGQAAAFLEQALALSRRAQPRMNPDRADILVGLGRVKMTAGRPLDALPLLQEADRFWSDFDPHNRWAGEAALWLGRCYVALGRRSQTAIPHIPSVILADIR